jgi:hypothetical protein
MPKEWKEEKTAERIGDPETGTKNWNSRLYSILLKLINPGRIFKEPSGILFK